MQRTIMYTLINAEKRLVQSGIKNARLDAQVMLSNVLGCQIIDLYANRDKILSEEHLSIYKCMINRRIAGEPVQYIVGVREFMSLNFKVNRHVLIPRPDTEVLVEKVIELAEHIFREKKSIKIADIGTGSGAIAVSLAKYLPDVHIYATDISKKALEVANENAKMHGVENSITFLKTNLLKGLNGKNLDIIVSNPPYIPSWQIPKLQREIKNFEPIHALDGGEDGLNFYRLICSQADKCLSDSGMIAFEVGYGQSGDVKNIIQSTGCFKNIQIFKDLAAIDRVVVAQVG